MGWLDPKGNTFKNLSTTEREQALTYWKLILMLAPLGYTFVGIYTFHLGAPKTAMSLFWHVTAMIALGVVSFNLRLLSYKNFTRAGVLIYLSIFTSMCLTTGGTDGPNIWWLITTPVVASSFSTSKETLLWSILSLGLTLLNFYPPFKALTINEIGPDKILSYQFSSVFALSLVFAATGYISISTREKVIHENEQAMDAANHASNLASLGEMAGGIAHEINNPLMIIAGSSRGIEKTLKKTGNYPDRIEKYIETINRSTKRVAAIIKGLKTLARDGINDAPEDVTVTAAVEEMMGFLGSKLLHAGITFEYDKKNPLFNKTFPLYRVQFSQVLLNLLSNSFYAIKDQENPWIRLEMKFVNDRYTLRIIDSGRGIPSEIADKIFTPFYTSKPIGEGTGLGLPLCHSIMQKSGGDLILDRKSPNTTFVITLPSQGINESQKKGSTKGEDKVAA